MMTIVNDLELGASGGRVAAEYLLSTLMPVAKNDEKDALKLLPVDDVDDEVHGRV